MASLNVRQGQLGIHNAAHLLRRTTYNVTPEIIKYFGGLTATQAINELFDPSSSTPAYPDGPLEDATTPIYSATNANHQPGLSYSGSARVRSVDLWRIHESKAATNAHWKIVNWVASIFTIRENGNKYIYHYWRMLNNAAFTNLIDLAFYITFDPYMGYYLNNNQNVAASPNENYAREFLELFTIGKGPAIAIGNYTNYTEADISQAARVLTGIKPSNTVVNPETNVITGVVDLTEHDTGSKTFSQAFQNQTINGGTTQIAAQNEVKSFIQMIFNQDATALRYTRKMYRYFVNDKISQEVETDILIPLATQLKASGYDHIDAMKTLFKSIHFYDEDDTQIGDETIGAKIKSPYELLFTTSNLMETTDNSNYSALFSGNFNSVARHHLIDVGLDIRGPITVEGYNAYNDGPGYSRNWYDGNYLYARHTYGLSFRRGKVRNTNTNFPYKTDLIAWVVKNVDITGSPGTSPVNPVGAADAFKLVEDMLQFLLVKVPSGDRLTYFQDQLLGGLSPINWYFSWKNYLDTGDTTDVIVGITKLYDSILSSPEFQIF